MEKQNESHIYAYDAIRIFAIFMVVFNHTRTYGFELYTVTSHPVSYYGSLILAVLCKSAVPLFFMVSGALLLGKKESVRTVLQKRVLPFFVIFVVMYGLQYLRIAHAGGYEGYSIRQFLICLLYEAPITPYWFLRTYLLFLLCLPLVRLIAVHLEEDTFILLIGLMAGSTVLSYLNLFVHIPNSFNVPFLDTVLFYPLCGYYLSAKARKPQSVLSMAVILAITVLGSALLTGRMFVKHGYEGETWFGPVWLYAVLLFRLFQRGNYRVGRPVLECLGSSIFGIYLIEDIVRNRLEFLIPIISRDLTDLGGVLVYVAAVILVSAILVQIAKRIPGVRFFVR